MVNALSHGTVGVLTLVSLLVSWAISVSSVVFWLWNWKMYPPIWFVIYFCYVLFVSFVGTFNLKASLVQDLYVVVLIYFQRTNGWMFIGEPLDKPYCYVSVKISTSFITVNKTFPLIVGLFSWWRTSVGRKGARWTVRTWRAEKAQSFPRIFWTFRHFRHAKETGRS